MPYINGRFYMNPQYGAGLERTRQSTGNVFDAIVKSLETGSARPLLESILRGPESSDQPVMAPTPHSGVVPVSVLYVDEQHGDGQSPAQQQAHGQSHDSAHGHWVTINGRHVFIQESHGAGREQHKRSLSQPLPSSAQASIYSDMFEGEKTSNGEVFHQRGYTAALLPRATTAALEIGNHIRRALWTFRGRQPLPWSATQSLATRMRRALGLSVWIK